MNTNIVFYLESYTFVLCMYYVDITAHAPLQLVLRL